MPKNRLFWIRTFVVAMVAVGIAAYALQGPDEANDLGLARADRAMGGFPDMTALRDKSEAVADAYLVQHETELKELCGGEVQWTFDPSLASKTRALGYRSSFYYSCWDIYLPYALRSASGNASMVLVQVNDGNAGKEHDPEKFRVLRAIALDQNGVSKKQLK